MSISRRGRGLRNLVLSSLFFIGYYEIVACLFTVISQINIRKDVNSLLPGFFYSFLFLEAASLISLAPYD